MKRIMWAAISAVIIRRIARIFKINTFRDVKGLARSTYKGLKRFAVNPDKT
jgi:hypothetical protein